MYISRSYGRAEQEPQPVTADEPVTGYEPSSHLPMLLFVAAHVPLALLMQYGSSLLTALHAAVTVLVGIKWALDGKRLERVAYLGAYITGAEVLWRMTNDRLFWETGKYAMVLAFGVAIVRTRGLRIPLIPASYFLLLLPSAVLTLNELPWDDARRQLSFNLSGPLALMVSASFFSGLTLSAAQRRRLFLALAAPIFGIAAIALVGIILNPDIVFTTESNIQTSGGYGPNQVSAVLGLGALVLCLVVQDTQLPLYLRVTLGVGMVWLAAQSAMTFSRGGLYAAGVGALAAFFYLARDRERRLRLVLLPALVFLVGYFLVWPRMDAFTGGTLTARFQETEATHRGAISESDFEMWEGHPFTGVGPGMSRLQRLDQRATHTEFTRLVAEHGALGALSLLLLIVGTLRRLLSAGPAGQKAMVASMIAWSTLFMLNSAMRLVAPAFTFGLAFCSASPQGLEVTADQPHSHQPRPARPLVGRSQPALS